VLHAANVAVANTKARAVNTVRRANHVDDDMSLPSLQRFLDPRPNFADRRADERRHLAAASDQCQAEKRPLLPPAEPSPDIAASLRPFGCRPFRIASTMGSIGVLKVKL
jgi:hypothetical protein